MNRNEQYIADQLRTAVRAGIWGEAAIAQIIEDLAEPDDDKELLNSFNEECLRELAGQKKEWPRVTDCERLENAFVKLFKKGIIAIHNTGWDRSESFHRCLKNFGIEASLQNSGESLITLRRTLKVR